MKNKKFMAIILAILTVIMAFSFASCQDEKPSGDEPQTDAINTDYILLYNGCEIEKRLGTQPLLGKQGTQENFDKYNREYHYYTFNEYLGAEKAVMTEEYENDYYIMPENGHSGPENEIAVSENVNIMPRKAEMLTAVPDEIVKQLPPARGGTEGGNVAYRVDLKGNTETAYVVISLRINGDVQESEINLYNEKYEHVARLAYMNVGGYEGGETVDLFGAVDFFDIDRDGNMEILVNAPAWEGRGSLSIYRYENDTVKGEVDKEIVFGY